MARDWLWELEARGAALRLRGMGSSGGDLVLMRSSEVGRLSALEAVASLERLVAAGAPLPDEALGTGAALNAMGASAPPKAASGDESARGRANAGGAHQEAIDAIRAALSRGDLLALRVRCPERITDTEIEMLEAMRRKRSVPAPPLPPPRPPVEVPLRRYPVRVVDDTGAPVPGAQLKLEIEGTPKMPTTDGSGLAIAQWFSNAVASVRVLQQSTLEQQLEPRWTECPSKSLPSGSNVHRLMVGEPFRDLSAPPDVETTIIIGRPQVWIELMLVDQDGDAVANTPYRIEQPDGKIWEGTTDPAGLARVTGLSPGDCTIRFPSYADEEDWSVSDGASGNARGVRAGAVTTAGASGVQMLDPEASPDAASDDGGGARVHVVQRGEHLSGIAARYDFANLGTIWKASENEALRNLRANPHQLVPGDEVTIPAKTAVRFEAPVRKRHVFTVHVEKLKLRLRLLDWFGEPVANEQGTLSAGGGEIAVRTDADGMLEARIPRQTTVASLKLGARQYDLQVGALQPVSEDSGILGRLGNLAYWSGPTGAEDVDGAVDDLPDFPIAIEDFARAHEVAAESDAIAEKLEEEHGA